MRISDFKTRVTVLALAPAPDGGGGYTETWQEIEGMPVYAALEPKSAAARTETGSMEERTVLKVTLRYRDDITPASRLEIDGAVYAITSLAPQEKVYLVLQAVRL